ncbi:hypothetical protein ABO04_06925 [Nitrosomonas sp. HPC101]|uniref:hypothetical protein n=1 Tax=Nitrosomonas sp. HPC101 TaxID=1658667 RepID=UPI00136FED43|nr:hypothetical protein [Nitrosomonas sp. HPC101]MXS85644.1 hypothetical protein [Nitrosomonas sp. HPC101]
MDILSLVTGFLLGVGAMYLINAFLLKPSQQKVYSSATGEVVTGDIKNLFDQLWQTHEHLLNEMKQDVDNPDFKFHREFYVLKKGWGWGRWGFHRKGPCIAYFLEDHNDLLPLMDTLTAHGLISPTGEVEKNSTRFQLSEKLVELLRTKKTS